MVTGSGVYQGMFQNILYELTNVENEPRIMQVVKLSGDSITKDGGASVEILGNGFVSTNNYTNTPLASGAVWTGVQDDVTEYTQIIVTVHSDVESANLGLSMQFYVDDEWHESDAYTIPADAFKTYSLQPVSSLFRIQYTNGSSPQTNFHLEVQYKKAGGVVSSHRIGDTVTLDDDATMVQSVTKAKRPNGIVTNVDASINGQLSVGIGDIQADAGGRVRVSQFTTLGDYKSLGYDHTLLMENAGSGSGTWSGNIYDMSVQSGQYRIKSSYRTHQYFSGKSQSNEDTFDHFAPETGTVKRFGYYSTQATGTYDSLPDGIRVESNGNSGTIYLQTFRNGTETLNIPLEQWSGYEYLNSYKDPAHWDNFTVCFIDFLWLGGAIMRLWVKTQWGFVLAHVFDYAGSSDDIFILSPNQPVRYEIRSTTGGSGSFRYICSQVSTEGSVSESGVSRPVDTGLTPISLPTAGVTYAVKAIRKGVNYRNNAVKLEDIGILVSSSDNVFWSVQIDPTLSNPLTFTPLANSAIEHATGGSTNVVTTPGTIIASGYLTLNTPIPKVALTDNFLSWLGGYLDGTQQNYVVCIGAMTNNVSVSVDVLPKEY